MDNQSAAPETFDIAVTFDWTSWVTPPRCRKPRPVASTGVHTARVRCVTAAAAPVVIQVPVYAFPAHADVLVDLLGFEGHLYAAMPATSTNASYPVGPPVVAGSADFPAAAVARPNFNFNESLAARTFEIDASYARLLIVDGQVYEQVSEPVYEVVTFGLGHNHASTALMVVPSPSNMPHVYPATDLPEAIAGAVAVATNRGDTYSVAQIQATDPIVVLDASYVTQAHLADVKAAEKLVVLALVARAKDELDGDGARWTRIEAAMETLQEARSLAFGL